MTTRITFRFRVLAVASCLGWAAVCSADEMVLSHFEGTGFGGWKATGTAFQKGPASGDLLAQLEIENAGGLNVASSELEGDQPLGTLTSPDFTISRKYLSCRIGGGNYEIHTCLNLLINGKVVRSATGWKSDCLVPMSWDVSRWAGQTAQVQLVDEASGDWGHLNVAHIVQTDRPDRSIRSRCARSFISPPVSGRWTGSIQECGKRDGSMISIA